MTTKLKIIIADFLTFFFAGMTLVFLITMEIRDDLTYGTLGVLCSFLCAITGSWRPSSWSK